MVGGFNPYSAGAKRYRGAGTSANRGMTLNPEGYIDRSLQQRAAQSLMRQQGTGGNSQERSGLAQGALQNTGMQAGNAPSGGMQNNKMAGQQPQSLGQQIPIPPPPREPDPTWQLPNQQMLMQEPVMDMGMQQPMSQPMQSSRALYAESGPGLRPIPPEHMITDPNDRPFSRPPLLVQQPITGGPATRPISDPRLQQPITGGPATRPPSNPQPRPTSTPYGTNRMSTGRNMVMPSVIAPPKTTAGAPSISLPGAGGNFPGLTMALDTDLRKQRESEYQEMINTIVELRNRLSDTQMGYQQDVQDWTRDRSNAFSQMAGDFAGRGMLSGSGYGQEYTNQTTDFNMLRNALDAALGSDQRDVLQDRAVSITDFRNLLRNIIAQQTERNAQRSRDKVKKK